MDRLWVTAELGITPQLQRRRELQQTKYGDGVEGGEEWLKNELP